MRSAMALVNRSEGIKTSARKYSIIAADVPRAADLPGIDRHDARNCAVRRIDHDAHVLASRLQREITQRGLRSPACSHVCVDDPDTIRIFLAQRGKRLRFQYYLARHRRVRNVVLRK